MALIHGQDTLPRLFRHVAGQRGDRVAMREKDLGIWRAVTWREYGTRARHAGLGLVALGLQPGDVVSVIAENRPEWLYTDLGTMSVAGVTNGIYTTDSPRQVEYIVNDSGSRFFFAEDEEQLDKILEVRARCPQLVTIVVYDMDGLHGFQDDQVMPFEALLELGARYDREHPGAWDTLVEIAQPDDLAILVYTSGTTGPPKGAMLSHRNILFQLGYADFLSEPREGDQQLSFLPLSHTAERTFTAFYPLRTGATVNFAESIDTVPENIREVAPAVFFAVPRIWEKFYSGVALRMREATWLGRLAYRWAACGWPRRGSPAAVRRRGCGCCTGLPTSWCSTTSSARWGCTGRAARPPGRRPSRPTSSNGTWRSVSTCARCTGRRRTAGWPRPCPLTGSSSAPLGWPGPTPRCGCRRPASSS